MLPGKESFSFASELRLIGYNGGAGSTALKTVQSKGLTVTPSRTFVAIPELDEDLAPLSDNLEQSIELPAARQPPSQASRSLSHTLTRSLLRASASSLHQGDGAAMSSADRANGTPRNKVLLKASGLVTPRVSHVMLNGAEPDVLVRLDCDTSQSSTDVDRGTEDALSVPPTSSPTYKRTIPEQGEFFSSNFCGFQPHCVHGCVHLNRCSRDVPA